jgi:hypothetical protein
LGWEVEDFFIFLDDGAAGGGPGWPGKGGRVTIEAAVGEFEAVLRAQVAEARGALAAARESRDYAGIRSYGLRLRYLLAIAEEHNVQVEDESPGAAAAGETGEG